MMNNSKPQLSLSTQFWLFKKQRFNAIIILFFLITGFYGLYQGVVFKNKQVNTIENFSTEKATNLAKLVQGFSADTTKVKGKEAFANATNLLSARWDIALPAFKKPTSTALFSIGQADVFSHYYTIKIESFFMQIFKQAEIANPLRSLAGRFDVGFWIVYLLPLLIIILCFNTLSSELDNDNWRLISSQGISKKKWLQSKFLLVGLIIEIMIILILMIGFLTNYIYFEQCPTINDLLFFIGANVYIILWLSILFFINSIGKNTSANALYSGVIWTTICIIIPIVTSAFIETIIPVDNTAISRMSRRPQGSKFDDSVYGVKLMKQFIERYPKYKNANIDTKTDNFSSAVYQAYHKLSDDFNTMKVKNYFALIEQRQELTNFSGLVNPTASIDGIFASLAGNDAVANHDFVWQTKVFHNKLNDIYHKALFFDRKLTKSDYDAFPVFESKNASKIFRKSILSFALLGILSIIIFASSYRILRKK